MKKNKDNQLDLLLKQMNLSDNFFKSENQLIILENALSALKKIPDNSIHLIATDPPYFIDGMGDDWNKKKIDVSKTKAKVVGSLPVGMKFDREQTVKFKEFYLLIAKEALRVLKPGGFFVSFSQARLYHGLAAACDESGFEVRDMLGWTYSGQTKAFSQSHFIKKRTDLTDAEKQKLISEMEKYKTPQLRPMIEPICLAQKPKEGTFVDNWINHGVGLVDSTQTLDGLFPGQLIAVPKPGKQEKGEGNEHPTVKPVKLMEHLVKLFSQPGQIVLDPFLGSGTTLVATRNTGRIGIGIELEEQYFNISKNRIFEN